MSNKKVRVLVVGLLGLGGLLALNDFNATFVSAEENTVEIIEEEQLGLFGWMRERMNQGFHGFRNRVDGDNDFRSEFGAFSSTPEGHMRRDMHGSQNRYGQNANQFQSGKWLEESDELRREHVETMHPEWDEELWEEHKAFRQERFESVDPNMTEEEFGTWQEENDEWRREHVESMHPEEWQDERLEERENTREERRENNRRRFNDQGE